MQIKYHHSPTLTSSANPIRRRGAVVLLVVPVHIGVKQPEYQIRAVDDWSQQSMYGKYRIWPKNSSNQRYAGLSLGYLYLSVAAENLTLSRTTRI